MPDKSFQFKQFTVHHANAAMKVGTDGVLLGAWVDCSRALSCLDIGTGTGLLSLMIAQRNSEIKIDAIDIDETAVKQAVENVNISLWSNRITVSHLSLSQLIFSTKEKYDLIVCNPPYFSKGWHIADTGRNKARVAENLSSDELIEAAKYLLKDAGRMALIMPFETAEKFIAVVAENSIYCVRKTTLYSKADKPPLRVLFELSNQYVPVIENNLSIYIPNSIEYTLDYKELTRDFYLKF